ncbi:MAG: flavodoxin-dependent (E)-4-hydroxy-3-methylbut-2-enyl-diphosphate synthase [Spirochaetaceae bacterium]|nr:MAG: flavodoxin-dependent (E)-4-hydroxy-3-methylbut-2-enyl-diphosphate synthase [Spirochaetaceae bacterium]
MRDKKARAVKVKNLMIGGGFPVTVQTMWKKPLEPVSDALLAEINALVVAGCDILRFAVPVIEDAALLGDLQARIDMPLVADIHFDYKIALECMKRGVAKIRINPGNIGDEARVAEVIKAAVDTGTPLRIGVNAGSLPATLRDEPDTVKAMLASAELELELLDRHGFKNAVFSFKSSDVSTTIEVNRRFREKYDHPLHLGVTEAGPLVPGIVKNTAALYTLLKEGTGDTIRVSLSADPLQEVLAGREILRTAGLSKKGLNLISCPTCGRTTFPVRDFYEKVQARLASLDLDICVAIMGCNVNGPGEARHADLGITGAGKYALIFKKGREIRRELIENAVPAFLEELEKL